MNMDENCVDLTITSPPYDNLRDFQGDSFDYKNIANELYRISKPGAVVVWVVGDATIDGDETGTSFRQALYFKEIGFKLFDTMIYRKTGTSFLHTGRYTQIFEYMFVFSKG
jgi:site-specific DNA-methyltransferase (adenine-specific)